MRLRAWQKECIDSALNHYQNFRHFLCLATPASGKTIMAASLAKRLIDKGLVDLVICFSPSVSTAQNAQAVFENILTAKFDGKMASVGCSITYQAMLSLNTEFWRIFESHRVLVIFDEIHHCAGDSFARSNAWGETILANIKDQAQLTLAMSGTPWRTDSLPITLANYSDSGSHAETQYQYGLARAVSEKVCRIPQIVLVDNEKITVTHNAEKTSFNTFMDLFSQKVISYGEVLQSEKALRYVLSSAVERLSQLRINNGKAGGLIVAASVSHAIMIQNLMAKHFGCCPEIVSYKSKDSSARIDQFRHSSEPWIISIGMISEGTDIPRLQVCCHLSRVKTELYFRQIIGRILRITNSTDEKAWLYTFAEPNLSKFAYRLAEDIPDYPVILTDRMTTDEFQPSATTPKTSFINRVEPRTKSKPLDQLDVEFADHKVSITTNVSQIDILGRFRQQLIDAIHSPF